MAVSSLTQVEHLSLGDLFAPSQFLPQFSDTTPLSFGLWMRSSPYKKGILKGSSSVSVLQQIAANGDLVKFHKSTKPGALRKASVPQR
jgi:hypothetical protein